MQFASSQTPVIILCTVVLLSARCLALSAIISSQMDFFATRLILLASSSAMSFRYSRGYRLILCRTSQIMNILVNGRLILDFFR